MTGVYDCDGKLRFEIDDEGQFCHRQLTREPACLADIFVYAGVDPACEVCSPHVPELRQRYGWKQQGEFYTSKNITPGQQQMVADRIARETWDATSL